MSQISNLTCFLHGNKSIGWLCLEKECSTRVMCNVCAVKNHNKAHKVEELENFEQRGLISLVVHGIQKNPLSGSNISNSNSDSSSEKHLNQASLASQEENKESRQENKKEFGKNQSSKSNKYDPKLSENVNSSEKEVALKERNAGSNIENVIQPFNKRVDSILQVFKSKKLRIYKEYQEFQRRRKQEKEAAIERIQQYEAIIKNSKDVKEIQKSLDDAIAIIFTFSKGQLNQSSPCLQSGEEEIIFKQLSSSRSVIKGEENNKSEYDDDDDDCVDDAYEEINNPVVCNYEIEDLNKYQDEESDCVKCYHEESESEVDVASILQGSLQPNKDNKEEDEQQNIISESSKLSQYSEINQVTEKQEEPKIQSNYPLQGISKRIYLQKRELLDQLQNYFLELTKSYFDNDFTQGFCKLVQDQIESVLTIPSNKAIKNEKKFLEFVGKKWQAEYQILQDSLGRFISSLTRQISEYIKENTEEKSTSHKSSHEYLVNLYLQETTKKPNSNIEQNSRIRLLTNLNFPISSPIIQGAMHIPQLQQQVILAPLVPHQVPIQTIQNPHMQLQNRLTHEEIPINYTPGQQQYYTTIRQPGLNNLVNIQQPIQQQQNQLYQQQQQQMSTSKQQLSQQKFALYQQPQPQQPSQFQKQQYMIPINQYQIPYDQQIINQAHLSTTNNVQHQKMNSGNQFFSSPPAPTILLNPQINQTNLYHNQPISIPNYNIPEKNIQIEQIPNKSHMNTPITKSQKSENNPYFQTTPFSHQKNNGYSQKANMDKSDDKQKSNIAINLESKLNGEEEDEPSSPIHFIQKKGSGPQINFQTNNN